MQAEGSVITTANDTKPDENELAIVQQETIIDEDIQEENVIAIETEQPILAYENEELVQIVRGDGTEVGDVSEITLQIKYSDTGDGTVPNVIYTSTSTGHPITGVEEIVPKIEKVVTEEGLVIQEVSVEGFVSEDGQLQVEEVSQIGDQYYTIAEGDDISRLSNNAIQGEPEFDIVGYSKRGGKEFKCRLCQKICKNPWDHKRVHSDAKPYKCDYAGCERTYKCKSNLLQHVEIHRSTPGVINACKKCGKQFKSKYLLAKHESLTCNDNCPLYQCGVCSKTFKVLKNLRYHEATHSTHKPIKCPECGKGFASEDHLKVHLPIHEKGDYKCHCGKVFTTEKNFKTHYKIQHQGDGNFKCSFCGKNFISGLVLAKHKKTHAKPYACRFCNRGFINASGCYHHERRWHKEEFPEDENEASVENQQYQCPQCEEIFKSKTGMFRHLDSHFFVKEKYQCDICLKKFDNRSRLETHLPIHGDYILPCEKCGKKFKTKGHLREHMFSHNKPFECDTCGGKFSMKKYLMKHMQQHLQGIDVGRKYKCQLEVCKEFFPTLAQMQEHMKEKHPEVEYVPTSANKPTKKKKLGEDGEVIDGDAIYNCDICTFKFTHEHGLTKHELQKHNQERHTCNECSVKFLTPRTLHLHQYNSHEMGEPFNCEQCVRKFFTMDHLSHHISVCHEICGKENESLFDLLDSKYPIYICLVCAKYLTNEAELEQHEATHSMQELVCRLCKRSCRTLSVLKKHIVKCSKSQCIYCCQKFNTDEELIRHVKVHQVSKIVFRCSTCGMEYNQSYELKEHALTHEAVNVENEATAIAKDILVSYSDSSAVVVIDSQQNQKSVGVGYKSLLSAI